MDANQPDGPRFDEARVLGLARKAYREGVAAFEVRADRSALLVIDMQDEFVRPEWTPYWVPEATRLVPAIAALIQGCRASRVPVIFTVFSRVLSGAENLRLLRSA